MAFFLVYSLLINKQKKDVKRAVANMGGEGGEGTYGWAYGVLSANKGFVGKWNFCRQIFFRQDGKLPFQITRYTAEEVRLRNYSYQYIFATLKIIIAFIQGVAYFL